MPNRLGKIINKEIKSSKVEKSNIDQSYKVIISEERGQDLSIRSGKNPLEIIDKEVLHREDGPAYSYYYDQNENKKKKYEAFFLFGKRDKLDGPSTIEYHPDGSLKDEQWYKNDVIHRDGGLPAWREWDENGVLRVERYMVNGLYHRDGGPAYITYDENGVVKEQIFYQNGEVV